MTLKAFLSALAACASTAAAQTSCENGLVQVDTSVPRLAERVCNAADRVFAVYARCDVSMSAPVTIHVVDTVPDNCFGLYHCGTRQIDILPPSALASKRDVDGIYAHIPPDILFDGIVAHELTHALYDATPCPYDNCLATSEYLAYAMQFEIMPERYRTPIFEALDTEERIRRDAITATMYQFSPQSFATNSWRHFNQRGDQCAWMRWILDGAIVFDRVSP